EALHVAALTLRVDGVEREAGLAAAGQAGDHDQPVTRQLDRDVLEVVLASAANDELILGHDPSLQEPEQTEQVFGSAWPGQGSGSASGVTAARRLRRRCRMSSQPTPTAIAP